MNIHQRNYMKLRRLLPDLDRLQGGDYLRLESAGRKAVSVDVQFRDGHRLLLTLARYFELNGDLVPNPDMTLFVRLAAGTVEALSYQDLYRFDRIDWRRGEARLDDFLSLWLSNLYEQGYTATTG